jgi:hypothetical protein
MSRTTTAAVLVAATLVVGACQTPPPKQSMALQPEALAQRVLETRQFDTTDEVLMLRGALIVLQDEGYQLDEMDAELGVLTGTRPDGGPVSFASVVARPVGDPQRGVTIRVTFQGIQTTSEKSLLGLPKMSWKLGRCDDPSAYQAFFERLSAAVFLEARAL